MTFRSSRACAIRYCDICGAVVKHFEQRACKLEGLLPIAKNLNALSRNQILNMLAAEGIESEDDSGA